MKEDMGGRPPKVSDAEILHVLDDSATEPLSTAEVAAEIDIGMQGVYQRLKKLEYRGLVRSRPFGASLAWRIAAEGRKYIEESGV